MGEHVDEVVDDHVESVLKQVGDTVDQATTVLGVEYLVVRMPDVEAVASQVFVEEFVFVLILEAFLIFVDPVLWV